MDNLYKVIYESQKLQWTLQDNNDFAGSVTLMMSQSGERLTVNIYDRTTLVTVFDEYAFNDYKEMLALIRRAYERIGEEDYEPSFR